jgi:hypothetical protein
VGVTSEPALRVQFPSFPLFAGFPSKTVSVVSVLHQQRFCLHRWFLSPRRPKVAPGIRMTNHYRSPSPVTAFRMSEILEALSHASLYDLDLTEIQIAIKPMVITPSSTIPAISPRSHTTQSYRRNAPRKRSVGCWQREEVSQEQTVKSTFCSRKVGTTRHWLRLFLTSMN